MTYQQQIKDPRWQRKRLEVLEMRDYACQDCDATDKELHVHHPFYKRGAMIWEYEASELQCLCNVCHKNAHALDETIKKALGELGSVQRLQILGYIDSMLSPYMRTANTNYEYGFADGMRANTKWIISTHKKQWGAADGKD